MTEAATKAAHLPQKEEGAAMTEAATKAAHLLQKEEVGAEAGLRLLVEEQQLSQQK